LTPLSIRNQKIIFRIQSGVKPPHSKISPLVIVESFSVARPGS
jgi:hypothetical protein